MLGDHYFDQSDLSRAAAAYRLAISDADGDWAPYARYKLAWCAYNQEDWGEAIEQMRAVAHSGGDLGAEAMKDLARFYADAERVDEGLAWFASRDPARALDLSARVASIHFLDPRASGWWLDLADAHRHLDQPEAALDVLKRTRDALDGGWGAANPGRPLEHARARLERALRRLAMDSHRTARKLHSWDGPDPDRYYGVARLAYEAWILAFTGHDQEAEVRWAYAELLYKAGHLDEAASASRQVIALAPGEDAATYAANLVLDAYALRQDWAGLERAERAFLDQPGLLGPEARAEVEALAARAAAEAAETP